MSLSIINEKGANCVHTIRLDAPKLLKRKETENRKTYLLFVHFGECRVFHFHFFQVLSAALKTSGITILM